MTEELRGDIMNRMTIDAVEMKEERRILSRTTWQQYLSLNSNGKMPRKIY